VVPVASPAYPAKISVWSDKLIFLSDDIWISNGTPEGSVPASDQYPDKLVGVTGEAVELNGVFITVGYDEAHGNELWRFDPAGSAPALLKDIHAGTTRSWFGPNSGDPTFVDIDGVGFFVAASDPDGGPMDTGNELWKSDGTEAGTSLVKDINPGDAASHPKNFVKMGGLLFFTADDGTHGRELWKSDGTETGTVMVKDITDTSPFDTTFGNFAVVDGTLFFSAENWSIHTMLWKSDGTEDGTVLVKDIFPGSRRLYISDMVSFQGVLFFSAFGDNVKKMELWTSDGTEAGTSLFKDINESDGSYPGRFMVMGDTLYFTAALTWGDTELWKTDGTPAGTVLVKDINPTEGSSPGSLVSFHNTLFFTADDGTNGKGLWTTDGTAGGTKMINGVFPGSQAYRMDGLIACDDFMLFVASETSLSSGTQLWRSDGTEAGTRRIEVTLPDEAEVGYWSIDQFTRVQGAVLFTMEDETHGNELWTTDGTNAGTRLLLDLYPGPTGSNPRILSVIGERGTEAETLLFSADDYFHGFELWKVDGALDLRSLIFAEWKEAQFTAEQQADPLFSGPDADPDGDGISNLGEYVHGGSPNQVDANPVEILLSRDAQDQIGGVTVTFVWTRGMTDVGYELQISTDLETWKKLDSEVLKTIRRPLSDLITLRAEPPDIGATEVFVRLRVIEL